MVIARRVGFMVFLGLWGCSSSGGDLGPGEPCTRTFECADGLACVAGTCSADLGPLKDGAAPVSADGGGPGDGATAKDSGPKMDGSPGPDAATGDAG
ncbi:MAG: hypothetical protein KC416_05215 [Myxococcales bacterium]|nr:hypothetical protein [Myxococcales bacterium]